MMDRDDWLGDRGLTIAEQQAWCVLERRLVAEGVTGESELMAADVYLMRRRATRAMSDSLLALLIGVIFIGAGLTMVGLPIMAIALVGLSLGLGVVVACLLIRALGNVASPVR